MFRIGLLAALLLAVFVQPVLGDVVFLQDGRQIEGKIVDVTSETLLLESSESGQDQVLQREIPKSDVSLAMYAVNENALERAGNALIRARTLFYTGLGIQLTGMFILPLTGISGTLVTTGAAVVGGLMQLIAFWDVGTAGGYLIQASR